MLKKVDTAANSTRSANPANTRPNPAKFNYLWVVDWPMFKGLKKKRYMWVPTIHSISASKDSEQELEGDLSKVRAIACDIVLMVKN